MGFLRRPTSEKKAPAVVDPVLLAEEQLRRVGADLDSPHPTRHLLLVPSVAGAQRAARILRRDDREILIDTSARKGYWLVVVTQPAVIASETMAAIRAELEAAVQPSGGEYDTWHVEVSETP